jgi:hypothetical protein
VTKNKAVALAVFTSILQEGYFTPSEKSIKFSFKNFIYMSLYAFYLKKQGKVLEIFAFLNMPLKTGKIL